ncbi:MAG: hypothetical protein M1839_003969 [Geoglossum umbratile]|nr:MAG: hypothetical protein M1839_003969 [Geoglossum umbratile]
MIILVDEEKAIIKKNPIHTLLDAVCEQFESQHVANTMAPDPSTVFENIIHLASSDTAVADSIGDLLSTVAGLRAARNLSSRNWMLGKSQQSLAADIQDFIARFEKTGSLHVQLGAKFLEVIIRGRSYNDEGVWVATYNLVSQPNPPPSKSVSGSLVLENLRGDWGRKYFPASLEVLQQQVGPRSPGRYYSKTVAFIQSSGMGKSRLADAFGESRLMVYFTLRLLGSKGFPPSDPEVLEFLCSGPREQDLELMHSSPKKNPSHKYPTQRADSMWNHAVVVALLRASFENLDDWVKEQRSKKMTPSVLAKLRHDIMAPVSTGPWGHRSFDRIAYCEAVVNKARGYAGEMISNQMWRQVFDMDGKSDIRKGLLTSGCLDKLTRALENLIHSHCEFALEEKPPLVVVFDEVANLFRSDRSGHSGGSGETGLYVALNRIFSCLRESDVWFFVLSTESQVEKLLPPERVDPDDRDSSTRLGLGNFEGETPLNIFPPFVALQLDVEDRRTMESGESRRIELSKEMARFSTPAHMKAFGRPLWFAYTDDGEMAQLARSKLIGGRESPYNPKDIDQVFAVMSFRICLDLSLQNPRALRLARTAVNYHMRILIQIYQDTETLDTTTPSEPILSEAAIRHLCTPRDNGRLQWSPSIKHLSRKLLQDGVIERGVKGELYSRLILILARDYIHLDRSLTLKPTGPFTVEKFLMALYAEEHHGLVRSIEPRILNALMNFTHFTSTGQNLNRDHDKSELCHDLLRRSAALQLAFNQPTYDHLIPIYFGRTDERFEPSKCGVILVQVKNRERATTLSDIFREDFNILKPNAEALTAAPTSGIGTRSKAEKETKPGARLKELKKLGKVGPPLRKTSYFCFDDMNNPILFLLLDLGVAKPAVQVSYSDRKVVPYIWAIHSQGHGEEIFGCIKFMHCEVECQSFFDSAALGRSQHDKLSRRNRTFDQLPREFRYKDCENEEGGVRLDTGAGTPDEDGDVQMAET